MSTKQLSGNASESSPMCHQCGANFIRPTAKFCSRCGTKKISNPAVPPAGKSTATELSARVSNGGSSKASNVDSDRGKNPLSPLNSSDNIKTEPKPKGASSTSEPKKTSKVRKSSSKENLVGKGDKLYTKAIATDLSSTVDVEEEVSVLSPISDVPNAELEKKFTIWASLGPEGITPEMLMTENAPELATWKKGTLIGRGTYGTVYLGLLQSGNFYAVKCVELGKATTDVFNANELVSLAREIHLMQRLNHKNLCQFKGVWYDSEERHVCMFMQYIGGGSLTSFVTKFKPLPPQVVRSWTKQLLSGLLYLHSQNIIHRDVKGENVLVDISADASSGAQIKLVDFGAARRLTDAVSHSKTVIGTPYWMAPEVLDVSGEGGGYSFKADVWSVGCTVAEMLTGVPPWPVRANAPSTIMMIATSTGGPTQIPEKEATPGCLDFMHKCFVRDPALRPTVEELLQHPWILAKME